MSLDSLARVLDDHVRHVLEARDQVYALGRLKRLTDTHRRDELLAIEEEVHAAARAIGTLDLYAEAEKPDPEPELLEVPPPERIADQADGGLR